MFFVFVLKKTFIFKAKLIKQFCVCVVFNFYEWRLSDHVRKTKSVTYMFVDRIVIIEMTIPTINMSISEIT